MTVGTRFTLGMAITHVAVFAWAVFIQADWFDLLWFAAGVLTGWLIVLTRREVL